VARCAVERPQLAAITRQVSQVRLLGGRRAACFEMERVASSVVQPGALRPGEFQ
jgi:hypothetical protein